MAHKQHTLPTDPYSTNFWIGFNRIFWASYRFEKHIKLHTIQSQQTRPAPKFPNSDERTNIKSATSHRGETLTKNVRQLAIRENLLIKRSLAQTGVAITVALPMHALHCFKSPTKSKINKTLHLTNMLITSDKTMLKMRCSWPPYWLSYKK